MGLVIGISGASGKSGGELADFAVRVIGTCAVFYGFFLCRMLGAGDIKLMAVCVGILGIWDGICVVFCGGVLALFVAFLRGRVWENGFLSIREKEVRLAPYLFSGYCACLVLWQFGI